jgi:hypothetical protein
MGTFTLTFDTETESDAIKRHMAVDEMASILFEITHNLKKKCVQRFQNDLIHDYDAFEGIDYVFKEIYSIIENNNIDITEL